MYRSDWSLKPNGQAYLDLVFDEWWTDEDLATGAGGSVDVDGFKGEYELLISHQGQQQVVTATLTEGGLTIDVALAVLSADFSGDQHVDGADLSAWAAQFGASAPQNGGDADGNLRVDGADFLLWQRQQGLSAASIATRVPEPAGRTLLAAALATVGAAAGISSGSLRTRRLPDGA